MLHIKIDIEHYGDKIRKYVQYLNNTNNNISTENVR
jgi:hypothetical protein